MKQVYNPYLPSWEYIPDGEPHVFDGRLYVYGSHDLYNGYVFCQGDYVCYSADIDDLKEWRYEGVIYPRNADPMNKDGSMCLYAPDVTRGPDGRYYLYYVLDHVDVVSVAVCDRPAGKYEFLGYVRHADGTRLGEREGDIPQFDPAVLFEDNQVYLYTGFCGRGDKSRPGAMATVLEPDMLTIKEEPVIIVPGAAYEAGTEYEGHSFFEGPSIRKKDDTYYFVYSSCVMHELCYATSKNPVGGYHYGGVIVSNGDIGIDTYKPADRSTGNTGNNHGGMVQVKDKWYIFYHRQTNGTMYSRQGCAQEITILPDGSIPQVEMTSCGLNGGPLEGKREYPAYIACNLFLADQLPTFTNRHLFPKVMQDGRDGDQEIGYVGNINNSAVIGFKYLDCRDVQSIAITVRGYAYGKFEIKTQWDGPVLAEIPLHNTNIWTTFETPVSIPDGVQAIYLVYRGGGSPSLKSFELK